ncbi:MAG: bifunctional pyr operon transcriptional regulator/uracil phosphoribosyltransferase PyrR [Saprospiraceae bacterium]|nr:bifunctional pyr operon transcriptional regulator/uracil phosphoribosyltransferase PyrR [Saprospiraceae bacterium]
MIDGRVIIDSKKLQLMIERLCRQLIENYGNFEDTCLVGIQPRGILLADRIYDQIQLLAPTAHLKYGKLDITFHRDDFRSNEKPLKPYPTEMNFIVEKKKVILVDDVLYTARSVLAALSALQHFGRASQIELLVLIDRRFNRQLPIKANYVGLAVDAMDKDYVKVEWSQTHGQDRAMLFPEKR